MTSTSAKQYRSRAATRSERERQRAVVRQMARYQKRWERKTVVRTVRPTTIRSKSHPQFTEFPLF
jgi:hypothetical protein